MSIIPENDAVFFFLNMFLSILALYKHEQDRPEKNPTWNQYSLHDYNYTTVHKQNRRRTEHMWWCLFDQRGVINQNMSSVYIWNCMYAQSQTRPDRTSAVDWALKDNYISIYPISKSGILCMTNLKSRVWSVPKFRHFTFDQTQTQECPVWSISKSGSSRLTNLKIQIFLFVYSQIQELPMTNVNILEFPVWPIWKWSISCLTNLKIKKIRNSGGGQLWQIRDIGEHKKNQLRKKTHNNKQTIKVTSIPLYANVARNIAARAIFTPPIVPIVAVPMQAPKGWPSLGSFLSSASTHEWLQSDEIPRV